MREIKGGRIHYFFPRCQLLISVNSVEMQPEQNETRQDSSVFVSLLGQLRLDVIPGRPRPTADLWEAPHTQEASERNGIVPGNRFLSRLTMFCWSELNVLSLVSQAWKSTVLLHLISRKKSPKN
ncbi:hypothetical protein EYF80_018937 [Liparis tanakae]|uniref:Uncharacterized protein n=1 Tax=Liparis tanakae TaxID=230148 RepID=A0A4Z2I0P5_9TELE|nr:hypothetical protein EYF80_018937 [Liparis tanakae]